MQHLNFLKFFQTLFQFLIGMFEISAEMDFEAEWFSEILEIIMENVVAGVIGYFIWKTVKMENIKIKCKNFRKYIFY